MHDMVTFGSVKSGTAHPRNNYIGAIDPSPSNDETQSYDIGSMWITSVNKKVWVCTNNAPGAAVWTSLGILAPIANYTAITPPSAAVNNASQGYAVGSVWMDVEHGKGYIVMKTSPFTWKQFV